MPTPWCSVVETQDKMDKKMQFIEKYLELSAKISKERTDTLKHHLNYVNRQHAINLKEEEELHEQKMLKRRSQHLDTNLNEASTKNVNKENQNDVQQHYSVEKIKYKSGGGPAKDRQIVNERYNLNLEQIQDIRKQSHLFCQRNLSKIEIERKEKLRTLMLPLLKNQ